MRTMRLVGLVGVAVLSVCGAGTLAWAGDDDSIPFLDNYADAIREARATGKPIFLEFRCAP